MAEEFKEARKVDRLGRIVIPRDMRRKYQIEIDTEVVITAKKGGIFIEKAKEQNIAD